MLEIPPQVFQDNFQLQRVLQACVGSLYHIHKQGMACGPADLERSVITFKYHKAIERLVGLKKKLFELSNYQFNVNYPGDVCEFFYDHLKLDKSQLIAAKKKSEEELGEGFDNNEEEAGSGAYEIAFLHYMNKANPLLDEIFETFITIKKLSKVISTQYTKLLRMDFCPKCKGKNIPKKSKRRSESKCFCEVCGGTGWGKPLAFDEAYCSIRNGWVFVHSNYLQTQVTHRLSALDFPITTTPRPDDTYKLYSREIFVAEPGYGFAFVDLAKAERRFAGVYFNDEQMIREVNIGQPAIAEYGMLAFGFTEDQVRKNTKGYDLTKKTIYGGQYGMGGPRLHKMLIENYFYRSPDQCWDILEKLYQRYSYQREIFGHAFDAFKKGYWTTYFGQRFIVNEPYELMGMKSFAQIKATKTAWGAFGAFARLFASTVIQGPATGINTQIAILRAESMINERPHLSRCKLCLAKHDEASVYGPREHLDECADILDYCLAKRFETPQPYLDKVTRPDLTFGMQTEREVTGQWHVHEGHSYEGGTWKDGILYRA